MSEPLYTLLKEAAFDVFRQSRERHAGDDYYCVALYTSGEYGYVVDTCGTLQGLREVAAQYLGRPADIAEPEALKTQMAGLKWNLPDSPYHVEFAPSFAKVNDLLADMLMEADVDDMDAYWARCKDVHETCYRVLSDLRDSGMFDKDNVVFALLMGDQGTEEQLANIEKLNAPDLVQAFRDEVKIDEAVLSQVRASFERFG